MSRYIDVDKAIGSINRILIEKENEKSSTAYFAFEKFKELLQTAPTADVVEVRHGCWKICGVFDDFLKCSFCHSDYPWMTASYYKYCPTCGAKMDTERSKDDNT